MWYVGCTLMILNDPVMHGRIMRQRRLAADVHLDHLLQEVVADQKNRTIIFVN